MSTVLEARGLGKRYRNRWALQDCNIEVPPRRVVGLVGPNGAGKSTLLNLAVGLIEPSAGQISVLGARPADNPAQLGRVGFVAQQNPLYAGLTVAEHLRLGAWLNPRTHNTSREATKVLIAALPGGAGGRNGRQVAVLVEIRVAVELPVDEAEREPLAVPLAVLRPHILEQEFLGDDPAGVEGLEHRQDVRVLL